MLHCYTPLHVECLYRITFLLLLLQRVPHYKVHVVFFLKFDRTFGLECTQSNVHTPQNTHERGTAQQQTNNNNKNNHRVSHAQNTTNPQQQRP